jgi:hypothetical protein
MGAAVAVFTAVEAAVSMVGAEGDCAQAEVSAAACVAVPHRHRAWVLAFRAPRQARQHARVVGRMDDPVAMSIDLIAGR